MRSVSAAAGRRRPQPGAHPGGGGGGLRRAGPRCHARRRGPSRRARGRDRLPPLSRQGGAGRGPLRPGRHTRWWAWPRRPQTMDDSWEGLVWFLEQATEMQAEDSDSATSSCTAATAGAGGPGPGQHRPGGHAPGRAGPEGRPPPAGLRAHRCPDHRTDDQLGGGVHQLGGPGSVAAVSGHRPRRSGRRTLGLEGTPGRCRAPR